MLTCLLVLCKAERGAVLVYEDEKLFEQSEPTSTDPARARAFRALALRHVLEEEVNALLTPLPTTDAPAQSPEMTCWLVYRLPMVERGDGRADDAHSGPEMLPDTPCDVADQELHVLLVIGWENQHDPKRVCASLIPQRAVLLLLVANAARALAAIKGYAATLLRHEHHLAREERHQFLLAMNEASDRLEVIIEHLLEVSQLENGQVTLERSPVDMAHLAGASIAVIEEQVTASWPGRFVFSLQRENADGTPGHVVPLILTDPRIYATKYVREMRLRYRPGDSCRAPGTYL